MLVVIVPFLLLLHCIIICTPFLSKANTRTPSQNTKKNTLWESVINDKAPFKGSLLCFC